MLLGGHRLSGEVAEPILVGLYSMPKITLYPVILLLFGLGMSAKVAFGALHGIIPVVLFTMNAVRNVNRTYLRAGRAMRLTPSQTAWFVLMPATLPEIFSGLRIGFSLTLLGTMLGELFASQRGLGFLLMTAIDLHDVKTILSIAVLHLDLRRRAELRSCWRSIDACIGAPHDPADRHEQGHDRSRPRRAAASPDLSGAGRRHRHGPLRHRRAAADRGAAHAAVQRLAHHGAPRDDQPAE